MKRAFVSTLAALGLAALALIVGAAPARAGTVDFFCVSTSVIPSTTTPCSGSVGLAAGVWSTTGITVFDTNGPYLASQAFTLIFATGGSITLTGNGPVTDQLKGTVSSSFTTGTTTFAGTTFNTLALNVTWTSLPAAICATVGTSGGCPGVGNLTSVTFLTNGSGQVVHVLLTPVPEPATLAMFGSGLAMVGGLLRRRLRGGA